jgi:proline iminopeptidase
LIEGEGETVLVIGSSLYYPKTFSKELKKSVRLIHFDHRGFSFGSMQNANHLKLETILDDIECLRKHLGLDQFFILGHSGRGYMALE